jgi:hypothetical protein
MGLNLKVSYRRSFKDEHKKGFRVQTWQTNILITLYRKVKRTTIALENKEYPVLMASLDIEADHENIIVNKIIPMINEVGL